VADPDN